MFLSCLQLLFGADDTMQAGKGFQAIIRGGDNPPAQHNLAIVKVVGATTKMGMVVTHNGETFPFVAPAITTDISWVGVALEPQNLLSVLNVDPDWDLDDVLPINQQLVIAKRGSGLVVALFLEAIAGPIAVAKGDLVAIGTEAGKVRKWTYTDAAAATDSFLEVVGTVMEANAGSAADDKAIFVRLDQ